MKRLTLICMALILAIVSGCSKLPETTDEPVASPTAAALTDAPSAEPADDPAQQDDPPRMIVFRGMDEYRAFAASTELDDAEFQEFISANSYDMNGVETKGDAAHVLEALGSMPIAEAEGLELERASLCLERDELYVLYKSTGEELYYIGYDMTLSQSSEDAEAAAERLEFETITINVGNAAKVTYLVRAVDNTDETGETAYYFTNIDSHWTRLVTTMPEDMLLSTLQSCRYTTFDEYGGK